jgi:hypothetical protein
MFRHWTRILFGIYDCCICIDFLLVSEFIKMFIFSFKSHLSFTEFVKWILPICPNIHTLKLRSIDQPNDLHNDIIRLKKLKILDIVTIKGIDRKEVTCVAFRT